MIIPGNFFNWLSQNDIRFFAGVPDSLLKNICAYITDNTTKDQHIITANEGNAVALAAGYHMATGKIPMVYMQNSGIGNAINPLLSLVDKQVYKIPVLLMIGWRGEPGVKDEPQHITQGEVTTSLLDSAKIPYKILSQGETEARQQLSDLIQSIKETGYSHALLVRKATFDNYKIQTATKSAFSMLREEAINIILDQLHGDEIIVSTTGKTSRELFECREQRKQSHHFDFLTVGSMGHTSQIALGIAKNKPNKKIICLDGDGAVLMHMGSLAIIGNAAPENFIHIVLNNGAHESVGGQPTVGFNIDIPSIALASKYKKAISVATTNELAVAIQQTKKEVLPALIEVKVKTGARNDLGRPTIKPIDNKEEFMKNLSR